MHYPQLNGATIPYMAADTSTPQTETLATLTLPGVIDADNLDSVNETWYSSLANETQRLVALRDILGGELLASEPLGGSSMAINASSYYSTFYFSNGIASRQQPKCLAVPQDHVELLVMPIVSAGYNFTCQFGVEGSQKFAVNNAAGASLSVLLNGVSIGTPTYGCAVRILCQSAADKSSTILRYGVNLTGYTVPALTTTVVLPYQPAFLAYLTAIPSTSSSIVLAGGGGGTGKLLWQLNG